MTFKTILKGAGAAIAALAFGASAAVAQTCDIAELSSATGQLYLEAQNALVVDDNPAAALAGINKLRALDLNCYEEGAVLGLSAQVKLQTEDYQGAINDLRTSLDKGYIPAANRLVTLKTLGHPENNLPTLFSGAEAGRRIGFCSKVDLCWWATKPR